MSAETAAIPDTARDSSCAPFQTGSFLPDKIFHKIKARLSQASSFFSLYARLSKNYLCFFVCAALRAYFTARRFLVFFDLELCSCDDARFGMWL